MLMGQFFLLMVRLQRLKRHLPRRKGRLRLTQGRMEWRGQGFKMIHTAVFFPLHRSVPTLSKSSKFFVGGSTTQQEESGQCSELNFRGMYAFNACADLTSVDEAARFAAPRDHRTWRASCIECVILKLTPHEECLKPFSFFDHFLSNACASPHRLNLIIGCSLRVLRSKSSVADTSA